MKNRKKYLIDKKFQLKTIFTIMTIVTSVTVIIILAISVNIVYNNEKIENIHEIQNNIVSFLTTRSLGANGRANRDAIKIISQNQSRNMKTLNRIIYYNKILIISILILVVIESIILFIILIRKTHRISGPIYVMSNYMKDIIEGSDFVFRPLRKKDEFKDFYQLFQDMVQKIRERGGIK
ncbi:hypothetical protein ACFL20_03460 [Spirochaetota bacterium]